MIPLYAYYKAIIGLTFRKKSREGVYEKDGKTSTQTVWSLRK